MAARSAKGGRSLQHKARASRMTDSAMSGGALRSPASLVPDPGGTTRGWPAALMVVEGPSVECRRPFQPVQRQDGSECIAF